MEPKNFTSGKYDFKDGVIVHELPSNELRHEDNTYSRIQRFAYRKPDANIIKVFDYIIRKIPQDEYGRYFTNDKIIGGINSWLCGRSRTYDDSLYTSTQQNKCFITDALKTEIRRIKKEGFKLNI